MSHVEAASTAHGSDGFAPDPSESAAPAEATYRSHFAAWLGGMSEEARQLAFLLEREEASAPLRRLAADSLNQLLHSADMIPEGTEALGYLETLFAFRMLAAELSEAAFAAPRLPKPRQPKAEPAQVEPAEVEAGEAAEAAEAEPVEVAGVAESSGSEAEGSGAEYGEAEAAAVEPGTEAVEAPEVEPSDDEPRKRDVAVAEATQSAEEEGEPERAQASDESYAIARRLAPQAALVRAFLGADDAERLRRLVLEQRNRASRGRSSKEVLLANEARGAAASEARAWAESFEAPDFGSTQHDLLRLRTFMKTRVRRGAA